MEGASSVLRRLGAGPAILVLSLLSPLAAAENWPQWRGPRADGISRDRGFPVEWDRERNVRWKAPLSGRGASTPIVWDDLVFITLQLGEGPMETRLPRDRGNEASWEQGYDPGAPIRFVVQAHHRDDGRLVWKYRIDAGPELPSVYPTHNLASPSIVTDGDLLYAWFGTGQLVALDLDGGLVWSRHLGEEYFPFRVQRGHASSPVLHEDRILLLVDHTDKAMLLALDKRTGEERFRIDRGKGRRSYSTPLVARTSGGDQLIVNSDDRIDAYDASTGRWLWKVGESVPLAAPSPVFHDGVLYVNRGYTSGPYLAARPGGPVEWRVATGGPYVSSLLHHEGILYMATERGIASVHDARSGERLWRERLGGVYHASPVAAEGRVYFLSEGGETVVLSAVSAGSEPAILARNPLDERCLGSPALSRGEIFIRTDGHLFALAEPR